MSTYVNSWDSSASTGASSELPAKAASSSSITSFAPKWGMSQLAQLETISHRGPEDTDATKTRNDFEAIPAEPSNWASTLPFSLLIEHTPRSILTVEQWNEYSLPNILEDERTQVVGPCVLGCLNAGIARGPAKDGNLRSAVTINTHHVETEGIDGRGPCPRNGRNRRQRAFRSSRTNAADRPAIRRSARFF